MPLATLTEIRLLDCQFNGGELIAVTWPELIAVT